MPKGKSRHALDARRPTRSDAVDWNGYALHIGAGFDRHGAVREVFPTGLLSGSDLALIASDTGILLSMLLQQGYSLDEVFAKLMRGSVDDAGVRFRLQVAGAQKPSLIAAIVATAIRIEREEACAIRDIAHPVSP